MTTSIDRLKLKGKTTFNILKLSYDNLLQEIEEVGEAGKYLEDFPVIVGGWVGWWVGGGGGLRNECHAELKLNLGGDSAGEYQDRT